MGDYSLETAKKCPRKAFLNAEIKGGATKQYSIRRILEQVLLQIDPTGVKEQEVNALIDAEFAKSLSGSSQTMVPFEAEAESSRMKTLVWRYILWEKMIHSFKPLAENVNVDVTFAGQTRKVHVSRIMDRGNGVIEAILYSYKSPFTTLRSKKNHPRYSVQLLMLQLAGEAWLRDNGLSGSVSGVLCCMKARTDKVGAIESIFERSSGNNLSVWHFDSSDIAQMEQEYSLVRADARVEACNPADCRDCICDDLCHLEFKKRALREPEVTPLKPINQIRLTENQRKLVMLDSGIFKVDAVAGSGKTTVISLRTMRMLEEGACDPDQILMITFTDKAAKEMKDRLKAYEIGALRFAGALHCDQVECKTFNGWGNDILTQHYAKLGFSEPPQLVDDVDKKDIILGLLDSNRRLPLDYANPFMETRAASGAVIVLGKVFDAMKAEHVETVAQTRLVTGAQFANRETEILDLYERYNAELVRRNLIDYEDQLRLLLALKPFGVFKAMKYRHVIIDEFQDSNPNQMDLIETLCEEAPNIESLIVVGDTMQAIYGFRNATPENLMTFNQKFKGVVDVPLEDNFRSNQPIIHVANNILRRSKMQRAMIAHRNDHNIVPVVKYAENSKDELQLFVDEAERLISQGETPSDIAVLARSKAELIKIQTAMDEAGIPTILRVPEIIGNAPFCKAVIALAEYLLDKENRLSLALYAKSLGLDPFDVAKLDKLATAINDCITASTTEAQKIASFYDLCAEAAEDYIGKSFLDSLRNKNFPTLYALLSYCRKYKQYGIKQSYPTKREEANAVNLITVHSSKGLEWPNVFLTLRTFHTDAEEQRLLYVGVTRAESRLLVTFTEKQNYLVQMLQD